MTNHLQGFFIQHIFCGFISRWIFFSSWIMFRHQICVVSSTSWFLLFLRCQILIYINRSVNHWFVYLYIVFCVVSYGSFLDVTNGFGCYTPGRLLFWRTSCNISRIKAPKIQLRIFPEEEYFLPVRLYSTISCTSSLSISNLFSASIFINILVTSSLLYIITLWIKTFHWL